ESQSTCSLWLSSQEVSAFIYSPTIVYKQRWRSPCLACFVWCVAGLETDGIYRVSGNLAVIQKLRFLVNHEEKLNLDESEWEDIHVITGALKLFFRELPEPLVPYGFFTDIVETVKMSDYMDKIDRLKCLVLNMPPPNHDTLQFMCRHLKRVLENSETNRMTTQNIGIVFGPTLMRPERDNGNMAVNMVYQNQAVELILTEFDHIFGTRGLS
uniref:Rho GTPase activating protein 9 n=1 Tax=Neolamprologus brichardi TaxID=32507 RepID=A0A3Q4MAC8_NEOBR